jgi:hypothetical protein
LGDLGSFPAYLTPELAAGLHDAALAFLHHHHIRDEPVSWHPPLTLLSGLDLPGPDPSRLDIAEVHRSIRQSRARLRATAKQLDTTIDAVRYLLEAHPAPRNRQTNCQVLVCTRAALPKHEFADLYLNQRLGLGEIGRRVRASRRTITGLAREYGIEVRKVRSPRTVIDHAWLYEQYVTHRRTLKDIAGEVGMSRSTMKHWAQVHNIPLRTRGGDRYQPSLRDKAISAAPPAILRPALRDLRGWQRLQRFQAATAYPTMAAAAEALDLHIATLMYQINRLERDFGSRLFIRARRGHPMTPTPFASRSRAPLRRLALAIRTRPERLVDRGGQSGVRMSSRRTRLGCAGSHLRPRRCQRLIAARIRRSRTGSRKWGRVA